MEFGLSAMDLFPEGHGWGLIRGLSSPPLNDDCLRKGLFKRRMLMEEKSILLLRRGFPFYPSSGWSELVRRREIGWIHLLLPSKSDISIR
jgi:hypothetical protein